ncbi:hypothetical protein C8R44DRAFT_556482, partial [Mycena epipterygia]
REALHHSLGGSMNTSIERLPSLSDTGSMPSLNNEGLPSWLSALPRIRKPNLSPWNDEEP